MSETHPNAFRAEAAGKRAEAVRLNAEAEVLETQADEAEGIKPEVVEAKEDVKPEPKVDTTKSQKQPVKVDVKQEG